MTFADDLPRMLGDCVQIQQVISNLVQNAVDAMEETVGFPRKLVLRSRVADDHSVAVEVCDNGGGLKRPDRVFEAFFTTKPAGMGMGLAICRSNVEAHGGRLLGSAECESEGNVLI